MFSCNPINTIIISPTKSGYIAKEVTRNSKGAIRIVETCIGKQSAGVAEKQFGRMGYKDIQIVPTLIECGNKLKKLFA